MAGGIFNPDNGIYRFTEKLVDFVILSVFWLVCSLPLFTLGPATAALYHTVVRCIRGSERNSWAVFFRTFKENFRTGALAGLVLLAAGAVLLLLHELLYQTAVVGPAGEVLYIAYNIFLLLPVGAACYLFPVLSRFTFGVGGLYVNCARLAIAHLPSTIGMAVVLWAAAVLSAAYVFPLFVLPVVVAWVHSLLLERIFRPYIEAQRGGGT